MKSEWIWMPHPGHFMLGHYCRFKLNTYVNGYIISTVGELWPDIEVRRIYANNRKRFPRFKVNEKGELFEINLSEEEYKKFIDLKGDAFDDAYLKIFGYEEIGVARLYETMVFKADRKREDSCCPYTAIMGELDFCGYNTPEDAYTGHLKFCEKWDNLDVILHQDSSVL
jgi:hypothetical protein